MAQKSYAFLASPFGIYLAGRLSGSDPKSQCADHLTRKGRAQMPPQRNDADWVNQVPDHSRRRGPYEDYGWEQGQSVLPQFRDPSVHEHQGSFDQHGHEGYGGQGGQANAGRRGQMNQGRGYGQQRAGWQGEQGGRRGYGQPGGHYRDQSFDQQDYGDQGQVYGGRGPGLQHRGWLGETPTEGGFGQQGGRYNQRGDEQAGYGRQRQYGPGGAHELDWAFTEIWMVPGPFTGQGPRGYQRSDDRICEEVCERLTQHGHIDASEIEVRVEQGEVILDGMVDSRQTKRMVEDVAEAVSGVKDIRNNLRVNRGDGQQSQGTQGFQGNPTGRANLRTQGNE
jgi:hypothetical protein